MKTGLEELPLFAFLNRRDRRRVALAAEHVEVAEGRALIREGGLAYEFFVIESGTAVVSVEGRHRADLGPGDFFGEIGLATGRRTATVTATSPMRVVVMTRQAFRGIERDMPRVAETVRKAIEQRLVRDSAAAPPVHG